MSREKLLARLYREMSDLTSPECRDSCKPPLSCCSPEYCDMAISWASERFGVDLTDKKTDHPTLPFMGEHGCVIEPQYRPLCTLHVCSIGALGFKPDDEKWTKRYFVLRRKIDKAEGAI